MSSILHHKNKEIIEWLLENGCKWEEGSSSSAASTRDLDFFKWVSWLYYHPGN